MHPVEKFALAFTFLQPICSSHGRLTKPMACVSLSLHEQRPGNAWHRQKAVVRPLAGADLDDGLHHKCSLYGPLRGLLCLVELDLCGFCEIGELAPLKELRHLTIHQEGWHLRDSWKPGMTALSASLPQLSVFQLED